MQQFIPFEDDWDALEKLCPEALVPYRVGLVPVHEPGQGQKGGAPSASSCQPGLYSPTALASFEKLA
jgi:hypothetical protein